MATLQTPSLGPFCQSCGMPMERPEAFGTSLEGYRVNDYCAFCFRRGEFARPELTRDQAISEIGHILAAKLDLAEAEAKAAAARVAGGLKRWRLPARGGARPAAKKTARGAASRRTVRGAAARVAH